MKESLNDPVFDDSSNAAAVNALSQDLNAKRANTTGLKTVGGFVNSAFDVPSEDATFNEQYAAII